MSDERDRRLRELLRREDPLHDVGGLSGDEIRRMRRAVLAEAAAARSRRWWPQPVPATALATVVALAILALAVGAHRRSGSDPMGTPFEPPPTLAATERAAGEPASPAVAEDTPPIGIAAQPGVAVPREERGGTPGALAVEPPSEPPVQVAEAGLDSPADGHPVALASSGAGDARPATFQPEATEPRLRRNIRFATDNGTRVIWVLDPDLDLDFEETTGESS